MLFICTEPWVFHAVFVCHRYCLSTEDFSTQPKTRVVLFDWFGYLPLGGLIGLLNLNRDVDEMH